MLNKMRFYYFFAFFGLLILIVALGFRGGGNITGFSVFDINGQSQFDLGTYENLSYNGTAIILNGSNLSGQYTSPVFYSGQLAKWNNVSWVSSGNSPVLFVRSCDDSACSGDSWNQVLLSSPTSLVVQNQSYFQYRVRLDRVSIDESSAFYSVLIDYTNYNLPPTVEIDSPQVSGTYNYNNSISLNYSVSDLNLSSCWYSLDGASNVSLAGCLNSSINISFSNHSVIVYANDSYGLIGSSLVNFTVQSDAPTLVLLGPDDNSSTNASQQDFSYYVNSSSLQGCEISTDFSGAWLVASSNETVESGVTSFTIALDTEGSRLWGVDCNTVSGVKATSSNRTIIVDDALPQVSLTSPSGSYSSKANIPLTISVDDISPVTCVYTVSKIGVGTSLVVVMPQCSSTSFNVADPGSYQLSVTVTDTAGNSAFSTSSFDVGGSGSSSSGGGGGGGVSVNIEDLVLPKLGYSPLPEVRLRAGFSGNYTMELINQGNRFLNGCTISGVSSKSSWFSSSDSGSLSPGQHVPFDFSLTVPRDASSGETIVDLFAQCSETNVSIPLKVVVIPAEFAFDLLSYQRVGTSLSINYSIEELTGSASRVSLHYSLVNALGTAITEGDSQIPLAANEKSRRVLQFELPKDSVGEFNLVLELSTSSDSIVIRNPVFLSGSEVSGLVISNDNAKTLKIWAVVIIVAILGIGTFYFLRRRYLRSRGELIQ